MNKVVLVGRMTKDPELKFSPGSGNAITTFTLAVDRKNVGTNGKRETDFIPCVIFGKRAENTANYNTKGCLVSVCGEIRTGSYDKNDGTKVYTTEIYCDEVRFVSKPGGAPNNYSAGVTEVKIDSFDNHMTPIYDEEPPF